MVCKAVAVWHSFSTLWTWVLTWNFFIGTQEFFSGRGLLFRIIQQCWIGKNTTQWCRKVNIFAVPVVISGHNLPPPGWNRINWYAIYCGEGGVAPPPLVSGITATNWIDIYSICPRILNVNIDVREKVLKEIILEKIWESFCIGHLCKKEEKPFYGIVNIQEALLWDFSDLFVTKNSSNVQ